MNAYQFDTLQYAKKLEAAGFTREQAEAQAELFLSVVQDKLATKEDLKTMGTVLSDLLMRHEEGSEVRLKRLELAIRSLEHSTQLKIELVKGDLKIWFGSMMTGFVIIMSGILELIVHLNGH